MDRAELGDAVFSEIGIATDGHFAADQERLERGEGPSRVYASRERSDEGRLPATLNLICSEDQTKCFAGEVIVKGMASCMRIKKVTAPN